VRVPSLFGMVLRAPRSAVELLLPRISEAAPDFTKSDRALMARVRQYTMTSIERVVGLADSVRYISRAKIAGAIVECGVWKGGSMMVAALTLLELGDVRDLYLFDTFEGMAPPTEHDVTYAGGVMIVDDCGPWKGARQAVDESFRDSPVLLQRLDLTGRLVIKVDGVRR